MDYHFHLDCVQQQSRMEDLEEILANEPIPQTPMKVEAEIINFIDGVLSRSVRQALSKDQRLHFTFGVYPKYAHKVTHEEMKAVKEVVLKKPKRVGIGEMGYDLTDGCSIRLDKQMKVLKEQLRHYASKELCLDTMGSQLFFKHSGSYRIYVQCFNGNERKGRLVGSIFNMFGLIGVLLTSEHHPKLEEVM